MSLVAPTVTLRLILLTLATFTLAACASVPLGTMWKMKRLGPEGLSQVDAAEVRAAIQTEESLLEILNPSLSVSLSNNDEILHEYSFSLEDVASRYLHRLSREDQSRAWRIYKIRDAEQSDFRAMQRELYAWHDSDEGRDGTINLLVSLFDASMYEDGDGDDPPSDEEEIERMKAVMGQWALKGPIMRVDLQLFADDGFFTLLKPTRLKYNNSEDNP